MNCKGIEMRQDAATYGARRRTHEFLQVLAILSTKASVRFPDPRPPRMMLATRRQKYDTVVCLNYIEVGVRHRTVLIQEIITV